MKQVPSGTELARPFMPAKDFDLSKKFYETLGFEKLLDGDVAIFRAGSGGFILQRHYQKLNQSTQLTAKFDSHGLATKRTEYAAGLRFRWEHPCLPATVQLMGTTAGTACSKGSVGIGRDPTILYL